MSSAPSKYTSVLHDKHVLVLGGTSGIGFCVAEASLEYGATVCIASSKQSKLDQKIAQLKSTYPALTSKISGHTCDLSQPQQLESNIQSLLKRATGEGATKLDHIVFTAGDALKIVPVAETSVDAILACGNVRFLAPMILAKYAARYMSPGPASSLTLTGGTIAQRPIKGWSVTAAWGAGIEGMTRGLAVDLAPIRVNMVSPGAVKTELFEGFPKETTEAALEGMRRATLVGELGAPEQLAQAYLYAMKDSFVTGEIVRSDGG
ncbi:MAG: hypothetical protein Q9222_005951, partial [Ikaeria aurantiellina]